MANKAPYFNFCTLPLLIVDFYNEFTDPKLENYFIFKPNCSEVSAIPPVKIL